MSFTEAQIAKGLRKHNRGDLAGAIGHYKAAIQRKKPAPWIAYYHLGLAYYQLKKIDDAAVARGVKAAARTDRGELMDCAIYAMSAAVRLNTRNPDAWFNLGLFCHEKADPETALLHYHDAIARDEWHVGAITHAGHVWAYLGNQQIAEECYHRALAVKNPNSPEAYYYLSFVKLARGDYAAGWADYEKRWECTGIRLANARDFMDKAPMWNGQAAPGALILLHAEQGLGDTIQMVRYVPLVAEMSGARIMLEVQRPLVRLLRQSFPDVLVVPNDELLPSAFNFHCPLMSLPAKCGTTSIDLIPWSGPYVAKPIVDRQIGPLRVGLCWAGSKGHASDFLRSATVADLTPLFGISGVEFVSLQVGERAAEADGAPMKRIDAEVADFHDTARIMAGLDLVISVDTAPAHLAGALGLPTWLMLQTPAEFRWLKDRTDSPWYPSARLFRQTKRGQWADVIERVAHELRQLNDTSKPD